MTIKIEESKRLKLIKMLKEEYKRRLKEDKSEFKCNSS